MTRDPARIWFGEMINYYTLSALPSYKNTWGGGITYRSAWALSDRCVSSSLCSIGSPTFCPSEKRFSPLSTFFYAYAVISAEPDIPIQYLDVNQKPRISRIGTSRTSTHIPELHFLPRIVQPEPSQTRRPCACEELWKRDILARLSGQSIADG